MKGEQGQSEHVDFGLVGDQTIPARRGSYMTPVACLGGGMVAGTLAFGLRSLFKADRHQSQNMMRSRVLLQGATVGLLLGFVALTGINRNYSRDDDT
eukprot:TRINITY_DN1074_c0_g1_i1.p1 TRINITY_DN1074_c0_g1~~TRINITY_DN1074_c0_g1_i1.p1  ORF type:complete len:106 (+),score=23.91 TRINITY_DN1074_c0_g1_i1:29-319(+)